MQKPERYPINFIPLIKNGAMELHMTTLEEIREQAQQFMGKYELSYFFVSPIKWMPHSFSIFTNNVSVSHYQEEIMPYTASIRGNHIIITISKNENENENINKQPPNRS